MDSTRALASIAVLVAGFALPSVASAQRTVFVNLEQQAVNTNGGNDPSLNSFASTGFTPGTADGFPALDDDQRAELIHWFKHATVPFDIHFTDERPAVGNYDMLVFGSEADAGELFPDLGCSPSIGLADCSDADVETIAFMFWGCMPENQQSDMRRVAFSGLAALGFGWGLEGVSVSGQVMGTYTLAGLEFGDSCVTLDGAANCPHNGCAMGQQNATADLTPAVGNRVDDGPPTVTIDSPINLSIVDPNVEVSATVTDAFGDVAVSLEIVEAAQSLDDDVPPHRWGLENIPEGMWTLRVSATDADGNITTADVVVCVGLDDCAGVDDGGESSSGGAGDESTTTVAADSSGGDDGGDETTSTSSGGSDDGAGSVADSGAMTGGGISGGFGGGDADTGCGCTSDSRRVGVGWGLLVAFGVAVGRRRR